MTEIIYIHMTRGSLAFLIVTLFNTCCALIKQVPPECWCSFPKIFCIRSQPNRPRQMYLWEGVNQCLGNSTIPLHAWEDAGTLSCVNCFSLLLSFSGNILSIIAMFNKNCNFSSSLEKIVPLSGSCVWIFSYGSFTLTV